MPEKDNKQKKITHKRIILEATVILILCALVLVILGYVFLHYYCNYTFPDLVSDVIGNLIGVLAAFLLFDIVYNKLTQDAYAKETSQQITKTLMGEPEILDAFSEDDKQSFIRSTVTSMLQDEDAVDMIVTNMEKYFNHVRGARIRKSFDYVVSLDSKLPQEYIDEGFPNASENDDKYYLIDEEIKFNVKYLSEIDDSYGEIVSIGFAYDKKSLDDGLLEIDRNGKNADFSKCIFNEDLVVEPEAINYINEIPEDQVVDKINKLFMPILRIDNSDSDSEDSLIKVDRKKNGIVLRFKINYE